MKNKKRKNKIKESVSRYIFQIVNYTFLALLAILCIFPFLHLLAVSFSSDSYASAGLVGVLPKGFSFDAYKLLVDKIRKEDSFYNSYMLINNVVYTVDDFLTKGKDAYGCSVDLTKNGTYTPYTKGGLGVLNWTTNTTVKSKLVVSNIRGKIEQ